MAVKSEIHESLTFESVFWLEARANKLWLSCAKLSFKLGLAVAVVMVFQPSDSGLERKIMM